MPIFTDLVNKGRTNTQSPGFIDSRDWFREGTDGETGQYQ